jgi:hypothetical protein
MLCYEGESVGRANILKKKKLSAFVMALGRRFLDLNYLTPKFMSPSRLENARGNDYMTATSKFNDLPP